MSNMIQFKWLYLNTFLMFWEVQLIMGADASSIKMNVSENIGDIQVEPYGDPCAEFSPTMPDFSAPGRRISEVKCYEYVWRAKIGMQDLRRMIECTFIKYRVHHLLGGRNAEYGEYAHMGALGWKAVGGTWIFKCGASLISYKFALTAAHCSYVARDTTLADPRPQIVRLGATTIMGGNSPTDGKIKNITVHHRYQSPSKYYDIALVELEYDVEFKWLVHPACLHYDNDHQGISTITGWGVNDLATRATSHTLQVAEVNMINSTHCDSLLRKWWDRKWRGLVSHQVCAGQLSGGVDTCQGDSGGPLQIKIKMSKVSQFDALRWTVHRIVGVTSFGFGCGHPDTPGVYTRVAKFINWIEKIVWKNNSTTGVA